MFSHIACSTENGIAHLVSTLRMIFPGQMDEMKFWWLVGITLHWKEIVYFPVDMGSKYNMCIQVRFGTTHCSKVVYSSRYITRVMIIISKKQMF